MEKGNKETSLRFGRVKNVGELGALLRAFRKSQQLTLEKLSGLTNVSMRFLSELERGKETAELGKVLMLMNKLGLDLVVQPRDHEKTYLSTSRQKNTGDV